MLSKGKRHRRVEDEPVVPRWQRDWRIKIELNIGRQPAVTSGNGQMRIRGRDANCPDWRVTASGRIAGQARPYYPRRS